MDVVGPEHVVAPERPMTAEERRERAVARLQQEFPARGPQLRALHCALFPRPSPLTVWVWGGPGTGKTTAVARMLAAEQVGALRPRLLLVGDGRGLQGAPAIRQAYVDGFQFATSPPRTPAQLMEHILNQLAEHEPCADNRWKPYRKCTSKEVFEAELVKLAAAGAPLYVVLDHMDALLAGVDKEFALHLLSMRADELRLQNALGIVCISRRDWYGCALHPLESTPMLEVLSVVLASRTSTQPTWGSRRCFSMRATRLRCRRCWSSRTHASAAPSCPCGLTALPGPRTWCRAPTRRTTHCWAWPG